MRHPRIVMNENLNIPDDFDNLEKYAPALSRIPRVNPFAVPEGYFDTNRDLLLSVARISSSGKQDGFTIPENYFELLPGRIAALIGREDLLSFGIPENYFEELPGIIRSRIFVEGLNKKSAFEVPADYFEELPGKIQSRIKVDSIGNDNAFQVPSGYFDELPAKILSKVNASTDEPKVISLFSRNYGYVAAAASVALIISLAFFFKKDQLNVVISDANAFALYRAPVTKEDIKEYLRNNLDESSLMELASAGETNAKPEVKTEGMEKKEVIDYLLDNNVDVNEI